MSKKTRLQKIFDAIIEENRNNMISETISKMIVDPNKLNANRINYPNMNKYKETVYKKFHINRFNNIHEMQVEFADYPRDVIEIMWKDYEHRDKLIESGQYEEFRAVLFRENYLQALQRAGYSSVFINKLRLLSITEWEQVAQYPQADTKETDDTLLPPIERFHYSQIGTTYSGEDTETLRSKNIKRLNDVLDALGFGDTRGDITKRKKLSKITRRYTGASTNDINYIVNYIVDSDNTTRNNKQIIKVSKDGYYYIPGIGTTRKNNAAGRLVKEIIAKVNKRKKLFY